MLCMTGAGGNNETPEHIRRSVFDTYAQMAETGTGVEDVAATPVDESPPDPAPDQPVPAEPPSTETIGDAEVALRRTEFARLLGEFRRTAVLIPLGGDPGADGEQGWLTADLNGIRFILAFSDEQALARYAQVQGEMSRTWKYQTVLGARLLDVAVPAAGVPCGVALDCADGPDGGMVFPPVKGIVPDSAAVDIDVNGGNDA